MVQDKIMSVLLTNSKWQMQHCMAILTTAKLLLKCIIKWHV